jgi:hypothetical protein
MFFVVGSTPDFGFRLVNEALGTTAFARGVLSGSCSSWSLAGRSFCLSPASLPLSPFEPVVLFFRGVVVPEATPWSSSDSPSRNGDSALSLLLVYKRIDSVGYLPEAVI